MNILKLFKPITTFVFDIDGVLTDGTILVLDNGVQARRMNIKDGLLAKKEDYVKKQIPVIKPQSSKFIEPMLDLFSL